MNPPIPPNTVQNICGATGDLMRASWAMGFADAKGEGTEDHIKAVGLMVAQLLTIVMQREPTPDEMAQVIGG